MSPKSSLSGSPSQSQCFSVMGFGSGCWVVEVGGGGKAAREAEASRFHPREPLLVLAVQGRAEGA